MWHDEPVSPHDKPLVILSGEIKTPPLSESSRLEAGYLLRRLQAGELLSLPHSRPMPSIGPRVHELRIQDSETRTTWRIVYRAEAAEILVVAVFMKKTQAGGIRKSRSSSWMRRRNESCRSWVAA
ncbi:MAG: hypothetical protein RL701_1434 [Pseudomonadota bacterium]|jgi:phage-related protein